MYRGFADIPPSGLCCLTPIKNSISIPSDRPSIYLLFLAKFLITHLRPTSSFWTFAVLRVKTFSRLFSFNCILSKGPFIATRLNSTQLNSTAWTTVDSVCRSWRHKQKHDWLGCTLFNWVSWVQLRWGELCRYKHPLRVTSSHLILRQVKCYFCQLVVLLTLFYVYCYYVILLWANKLSLSLSLWDLEVTKYLEMCLKCGFYLETYLRQFKPD